MFAPLCYAGLIAVALSHIQPSGFHPSSREVKDVLISSSRYRRQLYGLRP